MTPATPAPDPGPDQAVLADLRAAFPPEWREPPLDRMELARWEAENAVTLPEPYRSFVVEVGNGSSLGPPEDGGLQPLGWLPAGWPDLGPRRPGAPFPLDTAWLWEEDETLDPDDPRVDAVFTDGSVVLGTDDGASFWLLVTTGPRRGEIWVAADVGAAPQPGAEAWGFAQWVAQWRSEATDPA